MATALALALCVTSAARVLAAPPCTRISVDPSTLRFIDDCGRQRLLYGLNVVDKGSPWLPEAEHWDVARSFTPDDAAFARSMGVNAIRLGAMWPGVVPARGMANATQLAALTRMVAFSGQAGIYSLLDAHQDALSAQTCGEGLPGWAARAWGADAVAAFPEPLDSAFAVDVDGVPSAADCATHGWTDWYFTWVAGKIAQTWYTSGAGDYAFFWSAVAAAVQTDADAEPWLLGYELINEPWAGDTLSDPALLIPGVADRALLQPLYENVTVAIRAAEDVRYPKTVFSEGVTWDDWFPVGFDALSGGPTGRALAFHFYSNVNLDGLVDDVSRRTADAHRLSGASLITEFEFGDVTQITPLLDAADAVGVGALGWEYKTFDAAITGTNSGPFLPNGSISMPHVIAFARPRPEAIAGTNAVWAYNTSTSSFSLSYNVALNVSAPTLVFISSALFTLPPIVTITPRGALVARLVPQVASAPHDPAAPAPLPWSFLELTPGAAGEGDAVAVRVERAGDEGGGHTG